jgi:hypothetical protein
MTMVLCILHQIYHRQQKLLQRKIPNHRQHIDVSVIQRAKQRSYRHKPATLLDTFLFVYNNIQQFSFLETGINYCLELVDKADRKSSICSSSLR